MGKIDSSNIQTESMALNAVCPYYTMFPIDYPLSILRQAGKRRLRVLDPFCGRGTTVSLDIPLQLGADANHNPVADRGFTLDGAAWPFSAAADDPCVQGPRVKAGSKGHVIGNETEGSDRETYTVVTGEPPVATSTRESLQISQFTTAGKLKSQFSFVEATDQNATTIVDVTWDAAAADEVPPGGTGVTFTFVVRDDRGGTDWATRTLCVTP